MLKSAIIFILPAFLFLSIDKSSLCEDVHFLPTGGKWERAVITDKLTNEPSVFYRLFAEDPTPDVGIVRMPYVVFSCKKTGSFGRVVINTGTIVDNRSDSVSRFTFGWANVSSRFDGDKIHKWVADLTRDGMGLLSDRSLIFAFFTAKKFVIQFDSASGHSITDEYLTAGLSAESLRFDCPALFQKK